MLYADGRDQRKEPLEERKALLERLIGDDNLVLYSKHVLGKGKALFAQAKRKHLEGIIGKKRTSTYVGRRTRDWVKIKAQLEQEFVVGGWTDPRGSRKGFGSLLLGVYEGKDLRFVGAVGTGFSVKRIGEISKQLKALSREKSPFVNEVIANAAVHYVKPQLVAEVRFTEWTRDVSCANPRFSACAKIRTPKTSRSSCPKTENRADGVGATHVRSRSASARSRFPISTRCSFHATASPRAI